MAKVFNKLSHEKSISQLKNTKNDSKKLSNFLVIKMKII